MSETLPPRRRLPRGQREQMIIDEATRFFAEEGLDGQTRALADRLGVTQPLLYRYFSDKESLVQRVLSDLFDTPWQPDWSDLLTDRDLTIPHRLTVLYRRYSDQILTREWVRIFVYCGLRLETITTAYHAQIQQDLITPVLGEIRHHLGLPPLSASPATAAEQDSLVLLHQQILQLAISRHVFGQTLAQALPEVIAMAVESFWRTVQQTVQDRAHR